MNIRIENIGPCRRLVHVDVPAEEIGPEYDKLVSQYVRYGTVPGFRQGKAPKSVVERYYADEIAKDARDRLVPMFYRRAVQENKLPVVTVVEARSATFSATEGLTFSVTVDVSPDFDLPKYQKITVNTEVQPVTDEDVEREFERFVERHSRYAPTAKKTVAAGDMVQIDYRGMVGDRPLIELAPNDKAVCEGKGMWVLVKENRSVFPGLYSGLAGAEIGREFTVKAKFPDDYHSRDLAGKEAVYTVTVRAIREKIPPAMDGKFLEQFHVASEAELKAQIRKELEANAERQARIKQEQEIENWLLKETHFDVPESLVQRRAESRVRETIRLLMQRGMTEQDVVKNKDAIMSSALESSRDSVRLECILGRIAAQEDVKVSDEEIDETVRQMAQAEGISPEDLRMRLEKEDLIEELRLALGRQKALDMLVERAKKDRKGE